MTGRSQAGGPPNTQSAPRQNVYFVPRDGIDREVITADICRYLGRDALVRPGNYPDPNTGQLMQGYHITAYRNLTSAMIQDLKNDSARWEQERRKHSSGGSGRYGGYAGAQGPSQYETSEPPYPSGSNRDSYEVVPRYPGSDAPGYSGSGGGGGGAGPTYPQYDQAQQQSAGYNSQYPPQGQPYPPQAGGNPGYGNQQSGSPAYGGQSAYGSGYGQPEPGPPYINVGAYLPAQERPVDASSGRTYSSSYQGQGQPDPRSGYYSQSQVQSGYTQPVDPFLGRGNAYPATSGPDYSTSTQPASSYQYVSDPQYEIKNQTPPPRAVASSPSTSTQAQTGNSSGPSHARHHRDRDQRDGSYSKSDRHSRRP